MTTVDGGGHPRLYPVQRKPRLSLVFDENLTLISTDLGANVLNFNKKIMVKTVGKCNISVHLFSLFKINQPKFNFERENIVFSGQN